MKYYNVDLESFKKKIAEFKKEDIIIKSHAIIRLLQRQMNEDEIKQNVIDPFRLFHVIQEPSDYPDEEKFICYFKYSRRNYHKYVLAINTKIKKIIIITVINLNRDIQREIEKHV